MAETVPYADLAAALADRRAAMAVIGLGYVGLPLAVGLAQHYRVIGYDLDQAKVARIAAGQDPTGEVAATDLAATDLMVTADEAPLAGARLFIVTVPTPVDAAKRPDLGPLYAASAVVGRHLRRGAIVVYESTVFPGCTEEECLPILERSSGLTGGIDFGYGYSPERINPGDREHRLDTVIKVVAGNDPACREVLAAVYGAAVPAGIHRAPTIKVAEAAKVIENTQRDLNIALVNELALIFHRLGIDTQAVLAAAGTKWNFLSFRPGLVGGHCIGVDPYYLTHRAQLAGYHPEVILAGRRINDGMGVWVAQECIRLLSATGRPLRGATVAVLGITFKEDCPDVRNTRVIDIIRELGRYGITVRVVDPLADPAEVERIHGLRLMPIDGITGVQAVILAVAHRAFQALTPAMLAVAGGAGTPLLDVKGICSREECERAGLVYWRM
jgi:UDP-N-acetyl-D-galactosamine dehydrogenase